VSDVGQRERPVQDRVVLLFADRLGYHYLATASTVPATPTSSNQAPLAHEEWVT
jgi:hypothetical protein